MSQSDIQLMEKDQVFTLLLPHSLLALFSLKTQAAFHVSGPRKPHHLMTLYSIFTPFQFWLLKAKWTTVGLSLFCLLYPVENSFIYLFVCIYVCTHILT